MFECPHCHEQRISLTDKLLVSSRRLAICSGCEGLSRVDRTQAMLTLIPLAAGALAFILIRDFQAGFLAFLAGTALYLHLFLVRVPLLPISAPIPLRR